MIKEVVLNLNEYSIVQEVRKLLAQGFAGRLEIHFTGHGDKPYARIVPEKASDGKPAQCTSGTYPPGA